MNDTKTQSEDTNGLPNIKDRQAPDLNIFVFPSAGKGQNFTAGDVLDVAYITNYTKPYLGLFCSNIFNREFRHHSYPIVPPVNHYTKVVRKSNIELNLT